MHAGPDACGTSWPQSMRPLFWGRRRAMEGRTARHETGATLLAAAVRGAAWHAAPHWRAHSLDGTEVLPDEALHACRYRVEQGSCGNGCGLCQLLLCCGHNTCLHRWYCSHCRRRRPPHPGGRRRACDPAYLPEPTCIRRPGEGQRVLGAASGQSRYCQDRQRGQQALV